MMEKYFVTGATGLVGTQLLRELVSRGETDITAFLLKGDPLKKELPPFVKVVEGDITDRASVFNALGEGMTILHLAAYISIKKKDKKRMWAINYEGTKNLVDAALSHHAKKLVYVSSSHVLGHLKGAKITEEGFGLPTKSIGDYEETKKAATKYVFEKTQTEGLDASVVYPSGIIGSPDERMGEISTLLYKLASGKLRTYVKGGYAFVDAKDVAKGIYLASLRGRSGQGYLLSGGYLSLSDIDAVVRARYPSLKKGRTVPFFFAYLGLPFIALHEKILKGKPMYTYVSLRTVQMKADFDTAKAHKELEMEFTPLNESIAHVLQWLEDSGHLPKTH